MVYEVEIFFTTPVFKFLFISTVFLRGLWFLAVILDIETSQLLFILTAKFITLSAIF